MNINLKPDKQYYSIGELARAFEINVSMIRFWENEFEILKPKKNAKGNRMFTPNDVKNLQLIHHLLKEKGFTIEGAKNYLKQNKQQVLEKHDIIFKLNEIKAILTRLKDNL